MKTINLTPLRLHLVLIIAGLLTLLLWPSLTTAMPLTAKHQLQGAWKLAADVAGYTYQTTAIQTTHPTARVENIGRQTKTERLEVTGAIDRPTESMRLEIRSGGKNNPHVIDVKIENGIAYGRLEREADWQELDASPADLFAPGGDPLGFLAAAENVQELTINNEQLTNDALENLIQNPKSRQRHASEIQNRYTFDLNGPRYASFMRAQLEETLRRKGELPAGITLSLSRQYTNMTGHGEIWLNADGLPVRQIIHLEFPPERGALEQVTADITTNFRDWELGAESQGLGFLPRWWHNPQQFIANYQPEGQALPITNYQSLIPIFGLFLLLTGLAFLAFTYRRSPLFYGAMVLAVLLSMLVTPLLQANQVYAFAERQQAKAAEYEQQQANQQAFNDLQAELTGRNFDPTINPINNEQLTISNGPVNPKSKIQNPKSALIPAQQTLTATTVYTTGFDSDGDGLTDEVELLELGTAPEYVDSDGDGISDMAEVTGFYDGSQWYLNPNNVDSNGDGLDDFTECPQLADIDDDGNLTTATGTVCADTDGDGIADVFDFDNDGDGVPDSADSSPNVREGVTTDAQSQISLKLSGYDTDKTLTVDFELRPTDDAHLWYTNNVLDWPDNDTAGQVMRVTDDTLTDKGDILLSPMLEIEIPYSSQNPSRGLPITDTVSLGSISATTPITAWLNQAALDEYAITVRQQEDGSTLYVYVPLTLIEDQVGDTPVAWGGRMIYTLPVGSSGWGANNKVKLLWTVTALVDSCDTTGMTTDYETHCATDSGNWVSATSVIQTYYEDFYLTGLSVQQDHGMEAAVVAQTDATGVNYENYLWHLADGLQEAFLRSQLVGGSARFDIAEIERRFDTGSSATAAERWNIPNTALDVTTVTYADQTTGLSDLVNTRIPAILSSAYPGAAADTQVTLLVAREESYKSLLMGSSAVSVNGTTLSVDLSGAPLYTYATLMWSPFSTDGQSWTGADLQTYLAHLDSQLPGVINVTDLLNGETMDNASLGLAGAISLAKNYYMTLNQGLTELVMVDGIPLSSDTLTDSDLLLSGEALYTPVSRMLDFMQTSFEEEAGLMLDGEAIGDAAAATFIEQSNVLAGLGGLADQQQAQVINISRQLSTALVAKFTKKFYKRVADIHGLKPKYAKYTNRAATALGLLGVSITAFNLVAGDTLDENAAVIAGYSTMLTGTTLKLFVAADTFKHYQKNMRIVKQVDLYFQAESIQDLAKNFEKVTKAGAIIGLVLEGTLAIGLTVYNILSQDIKPGSPQYYALVSQGTAQVLVAIFLAAISATVIGALVVSVIALIDVLLIFLCQLGEISDDSWLCGGLTGALTQAIAYIINDYTPLVDMTRSDRLDIALWTPTISQINNPAGTDGFVEGNTVQIAATITSTLYLNKPNWMGYRFSSSQLNDDSLAESRFRYRFQQGDADISTPFAVNWDIVPGRSTPQYDLPDDARFYKTFIGGTDFELTPAGINQSLNIYLMEGFKMNAQNCWLILGVPACWLEDYEDSNAIDMNESLRFDIFPNTIGGFRALTSVGNDSYRLAWHNDSYSTLIDADNDGLRSKAAGGPDPNDSSPDSDADGLSDYYEYNHNSDLTRADADCDGLTDYWEAFYHTNPNQADSDNDGLSDGEEAFHPNQLYPYKNSSLSNTNAPTCAADSQVWTGGWNITYDFNDLGQALEFRVSADPTLYDTDADTTSDDREKAFGYNPNVAGPVNVLSMAGSIAIDNAQTPYAAPGSQIDYTAVISNETNDRYAHGLLQAEFPLDTVVKTQVIDTLTPLSAVTMTGAINVDSGISSSFVTSMTLRAGALIDEGTGRMLWLRFNESANSTTFADSSLHGHNAACPSLSQCAGVVNGSLYFQNGVSENVTVDTTAADFQRTGFSVGSMVSPTSLTEGYFAADVPYRLGVSGGVPFATIFLTNGQTLTAQGGAVSLNKWQHVMFTFNLDETSQIATLNLYVDGQPVATNQHTGELLNALPSLLALGGNSYQGYLDDVEFYGRTLSAAEVEALADVQEPVLNINFGSLTNLSDSGASVTCSGERCPTGDEQLGTFDQSQYVTVSGSALDLSGDRFSIITWLKPEARNIPFDTSARSSFSDVLIDTSRDWQGVFGANSNDANNHYPSLYVSNQGHLWLGWKNNGTSCAYKTGAGVVDLGIWQHLGLTFDGSEIVILVNGEEVGRSSACSNVVPPNLTGFTIGRPNPHGYVYFDALDVHVWNDPGAEEEIKLDYDGSKIWESDVRDPCFALTCNRNRWVDIDKYAMFTNDNAHSYKLWEEDSWPNPDDTYLNPSFYNYQPFDDRTIYQDGNSGGFLHWSLSNDYFQGALDQFQLYNEYVPAGVIAARYNSTLSGLEMPFDEPPGQKKLADTSGNGFAATCDSLGNACPDSGIPGRANQALRFDGGVADDDGNDGVADVATLNATPAQMGLADSSFTVLAWVKPDSVNNTRTILGTDTAADQQGLSLAIVNGQSSISFYGSGNNTTGSSAIAAGQWTHLAWVYDAVAGTQTLYVNGVQDGQGSGKPAFTGSGAVRIGRSLNGNYFDGLIDELTIMRRAMAAADVQAAMRQAPLVNLHLDEDLDTTSFTDDSPFTNPATCTDCPAAGDKGQVREAAVFDSGDRLDINPVNDLDKNNFSVGMWVRPRVVRGDTISLFRLFSTAGPYMNFNLEITSNGALRVGAAGGCGGLVPQYDYIQSEDNVVTKNQWQHVMVTWKAYGGELVLYHNGQPKATRKTGYLYSPTCPAHRATIGKGIIGSVDEVVVYGTALSQNEVTTLYNYQNAWVDVSEQHQIIVDAEAPEVWLDLYTNHIAPITQTMAIRANDATSSVAQVWYKIDNIGGSWLPATQSIDPTSAEQDQQVWLFNYEAVSPGAHTVYLRAADVVGNTSPTVAHALTVDDTPPVLTVAGSLTASIQPVTDTLLLSGTITDGESGISDNAVQAQLQNRQGEAVTAFKPAQISGSAWQLSYPFPNLIPYGNYTLDVKGQDAVGNAVTQTATLQLDGYGPYADVMLGTGLITQSGTVISGTLSDVRHLPQSQRLHLNFEESAGATSFADSARNHFAAACSSAACPTAGQSGQQGQALRFDGADDGLVISGTTALSVTEHVGLFNNSFTAMAWINPDTLSGDQAVLGTDTNAGNEGLFIGLRNGQPHLGFTNDDTTASTGLATGQWTHLAWRYDNDSGEQAIFINGTLALTSTGHSAFVGRGALRVGRALGGKQFDGRIDDLVIYTGAMSEESIYNIANPLDVNVTQLQLRFRHGEDMEQGEDDGTWYTASLAGTGQFFTTWQHTLAANLEGPYRIDLKTTDAWGNTAFIQDAWTGDIDTIPPRLTFSFNQSNTQTGQTAIRCYAEDYNLTTAGWVCPLTDTLRTETYQSETWFINNFGVTDKLAALDTPTQIVVTTTTESAMTACDLAGHCVTKLTEQAPGGVYDNLNLWLRADTGVTVVTDSLTTWVDLSPNGHQAGQSSSASQPGFNTGVMNGYPVVRFDGTDDYLTSDFTLDPAANGLTLWAVARPDTAHNGVLAAQPIDTNLLQFTVSGQVSSYLGGSEVSGNSAYSGDTGLPVLYGLDYDGSNLTHYRNGVTDGTTGSVTAASSADSWVLGSAADTLSGYLDGDIAEVVVYSGTLTTDSRARIDSYLALKYGVTLSGTQDYVDSTGVPIWEAALNSAWYHDVAGLGRDNSSGLAQWQASSANPDAVVTMAHGSNLNAPVPLTTDQSFLLWGNDDGFLTATTTITVDTVAYERLPRTWRVQTTGNFSQTVVSFDLSGLGLDINPAWAALVQADNADLISPTLHTHPLSATTTVATFGNVHFADGDYFTLIIAPGRDYNVFTNVPEAADYTLLYGLDIPQDADYDPTSPAYFIDRSAEVGPYDRIAYYLELVDGSGVISWAYVSMPPLSVDPTEVGVPTAASGAVFEQTVSDMVVDSNVAGVITGTINTGNVEFWPTNYGQTADSGLSGSSASFDFDDTNSGSGDYGSFQIHNTGAGQTIMAWNRWGRSGDDDIGIGNASTGEPDWTNAANSGDTTIRRLFVLARYGVTATDDAYATTQGKQLLVSAPGILANDSISTTATLTQPPADGTLNLNSDGSFIYTPTLTFAGDTTFTYAASDGMMTDTATVTLTVGPANCFVESTGDNLTDFTSTDAGAIQAAVDAASAGDTLKIAGTCAGVQTVNSSDQTVYLDQSLTMQGGYTVTNWLAEPDSDLYPTTLDAQNSGRVLVINSGVITLTHLTLVNGNPGPDNGGGIVNAATLIISNSILSNHTAQYGGAIYNFAGGVVTVTNSTFSANTVDDDPGLADSQGGAIYNMVNATLTLAGNTFINNTADSGGAIANDNGTLTLINNTIYSNTAIYNGGALYVNGGNSTVEYNTIAANQTGSGDTLNDQGGGLRLFNGFVYVRYNIIADNSDLDCRGGGGFQVFASNIMETESNCTGFSTITADPQLGPLADNGGDTQTMAITADSPAYNAGDTPGYFFNCPATDQRGYARPQGASCDVGAFEVDYVDIGLDMTVQPDYPWPGGPITYTIAFANNSSTQTLTGIALTDTLSAGIISATVQTAPDSGVVLTYTPASTYAWTISDLAPGQGGVITISGQVDTLEVGAVISNTATITGSEDAANDANNSQTLTSVLCYDTAITVTTAADSGPGSLRQAIADLCEGGVITFDNDYTLNLSSTLTLDRSGVTIDGSGHTITLSGDSNDDGSRDVRVLYIESTGVVTLSHLNVISGSATGSFPDNAGGGIFNEGQLTLINSALIDNTAGNRGGGLENNGVAWLQNSTVAGSNNEGIYNTNVLTMTHVTIAGNGAGLMNFGQLYARNSILADNTSYQCTNASGDGGEVIENMSNLIEGGDCNEGTTLSGLLSADPLLGPLDYHGGNTLNYSLLPGSPAVTSADTSLCLVADQRGIARAAYSSDCDRGAHEANGPNVVLSKAVTPAVVYDGEAITYTLTFSNTGNTAATGVVISDALPAVIELPVVSVAGASIAATPGLTYSWTVSDLSAGQSGVITINGTINGIGAISNTATISSPADIAPGDNSDTVEQYICGPNAVVTTSADSGPGSLRDLLAAGCYQTITFAADTTIYLSSTLEISDAVTIDGSDHSVTLSGDSNGDGSRDVRVMVITSTGVVTLSHLNIVSGTATGAWPDNQGGGIYNLGRLTLLDSALADNIASYGGGLSHAGVSAVLSNSTIANNHAVYSGGGIDADGVLTLTHVTIAGNSADDFDGTGGLENSGTLYAYNSILADNSGPFANNCSLTRDYIGSIAVNINNLIEESSECNSGATLSGLLDADPQLGALDYHTGDTLSYAIPATSPALDSANATYCFPFDQRGVARPQGAGCDRGAFELQLPLMSLTQSVTPTGVAPGGSITYTLAFSNVGTVDAVNVAISDTLPAELLNASYNWTLDGGLTLSHTANTTYTWPISGNLPAGQGGVVTVTAQLASPLGLEALTNTATISATDGGSYTTTATASAAITVSNVAPVMGSGTFTISESSTFGADVGTVAGSDNNLDALTYTIIAGNDDGVFAINSNSGQLTISDTTFLNYESTAIHLLTVMAADGELTGTNTVAVNITNASPDLTLSKNVTPTAANPGDTITYTLSFSNIGSDQAGDTVIFDGGLSHLAAFTYQTSLVTPVSITQLNSITYAWELGDLTAGSSGTLTLTGVLSEPLAAGILTNTATITTTSDESNLTDNVATTTLSINNVDPVLTPTVLTVSEGAANGAEVGLVDAVDGNGDALTFSITAGNADGVFAIDGSTGLITVADRTNLSYENTPQYVLTVEVSVDAFVGTTGVTINVDDVDTDLSLVKTVTPQTALPGQTITYTLAFSNASVLPANNVVITDDVPSLLSAIDQQGAGDAGVTITLTTGITYAWTIGDLSPGQGGIITITGTVMEPLTVGTRFTNTATISTTSEEAGLGNNLAEAAVTIGNAAPVLDVIPPQTITETETLTFTASASDANGDSLTYGLYNAPTGATINSSTGEVAWTPVEEHTMGLITLIVTDTGGLTGTTTALVTVIEVNSAPVLATIPPQTIGVFKSLTFTVTATDTDLPANNLTYSLIDPPGGAAIEAATGAFSWTPTDPGLYTITVQVADGGTPILTDTTAVSLTVTPDVTPPDISGMALMGLTNGITVTTARPTFDWEEAVDDQSGVISYTLLITSSNDSISVQEASTAVTTTVSAFTPSLDLDDGVYTWTVKAHDAAGNASGYVAPATFILDTSSSNKQLFFPIIMKNR